MQSIQLYIKDENDVYQQIELFKDESITLTQSIQDVKDISKIFTDYSQTFSVPASKVNNKLFKHFYNYFIDGFDARQKKDAKLQLNYKPFKTGKVKLEGATLKGNKANTYKLTFYGSTINFKDLIGDIKLQGLSYFNTSNFTYSAARVKSMLSSAANVTVAGRRWDDSLIFPLITHTDRLYYDSETDGANANGLANLFWKSNGNTAQGVDYKQLKPAIRVIMLFAAIEYQFPQIEFSNDFISIDNPAFYDLFLWLNSNEGDLVQSTDTIYTYMQPFTNVESNSKARRKGIRTEFCDVFNAGSFDVLAGGEVKILMGSFTSSASGEYSVIVRRDGDVVAEYDKLTGSKSPIDRLELQTGRHTIQIGATAAANFTANFEVFALYSQNDPSVSWKSTASVLSTTQINIKDHLPDMKVLEFITSIFKMFNLTAYIDEKGLTKIQTLDSYYAGTTETPIAYYDITKDVDIKTSQVDVVIPFNEVDFKYKGTENFFAEDHKNRFGSEWGSLSYKEERFEGDTFKIEIPFEHFKYERLFNQTGNVPTTIQWGWAVDKDKQPTVGEPLLFYPILTSNTTVGTTPTAISFIGASGHEEIAGSVGYYVPSNSNTFNDIGNLNFNAEINEYVSRPFNKTLFNQYYETYIKDIFKTERRLTNLSAYISVGVLTNLELYDRLIIADRVYKINKITTNFETQLSKLELINVFDDRKFVQNLNQAIATVDADFSGVGLTADSTLVTADAGVEYEEVIQMPIRQIPTTIPTNTPEPINNVPCTVTASTLGHPTQNTNTNSTVFFKHTISAVGKICEVQTLESYGFIHAATEALVTGTDLNTLIAASGVTTIQYRPSDVTGLNNAQTYTAEVTGLSQNTVKFWRFFARTNTTTNFDKVDAISGIYASKAAASVVYVETSNVIEYTRANGVIQDNEYRTLRIMDKDQNLLTYTGLRGYPNRLYSKIVPYVVEGLPLNFTASSGGYQGQLAGIQGEGVICYYHASNRQAAINAAKANAVGNTGAVRLSGIQAVVQGIPIFNMVKSALDFENITIYRNMFQGFIASFGAIEAYPDGFFAYKLHNYSIEPTYDYINSTIPDDSYLKNYADNFPQAELPMVKSVQQLNAITKNGQLD